MFDQILVPVDGSLESARALRPASAVSHYLGVPMRVVAYHAPSDDGFDLTQLVQRQVREIGDVERTIEIEAMTSPVPELLKEKLDAAPEALLAMSTRGQGRAAALIGSVATGVLARTHRPVLLVGPNCDIGAFRLHGRMVIATDASAGTEPILALAKAVVDTFDYEPVVVNVIDAATDRALSQARRGPGGYEIVPDSAMVQRYAQDLGRATDRSDIDFHVLHDKRPGKALAAFATDVGAALVTMSTHARSGLKRLTAGSVAAEVVAAASCPVLALAPDDFDD